jgi:hypothetical protein
MSTMAGTAWILAAAMLSAPAPVPALQPLYPPVVALTPPDYLGGSLVNLIAELERRLTGSAVQPGLHPALASTIPDADSYVLVLFDGLGDRQLEHRAADALRSSRVGAIDAPFPTTTTVSMATVATGLPPIQHGVLGYQMWVPETEHVVNTIKWTTLWGDPVHYDIDSLLPTPNLWERLTGAGCEPITLQPWNFDDSPMSRMLYRGCRFEPWGTEEEAAEAAAQLAAVPGRLVFLYIPHVDFAAHVSGQASEDYDEAMSLVAGVWERLARRLPPGAVAVGTADHGHIDVPESKHIEIAKGDHDDRDFAGDSRVMFVHGEGESLAATLGVEWITLPDMRHLWGAGAPHPAFAERAPDGVLVAPPGGVILHRASDDRLVGHHGGLTDEERRIPLLVARGE